MAKKNDILGDFLEALGQGGGDILGELLEQVTGSKETASIGGELLEGLAENGGSAVQSMLLDKLNVPFDRNSEGRIDMTLEGGHAAPRIAHCADYTGRTIIEYMHEAVGRHPNITVMPRRSANSACVSSTLFLLSAMNLPTLT